jgi:DNA-binding winged helix-turn-helix (wHTH) protein
MESLNRKAVYEFGDMVLDPEERKLSVSGEEIHLPAKEFETLLFFVEHYGKALTKEEMMSALWQSSFVEEGNPRQTDLAAKKGDMR